MGMAMVGMVNHTALMGTMHFNFSRGGNSNSTEHVDNIDVLTYMETSGPKA